MRTFESGVQFVAKFAKRVVAGFVVGNDVYAVPRATGVLEEVVARVDGRVHGRQQARRCTVHQHSTID